MVLPSATVKSACAQLIPAAINPAESMYVGMQWAMLIHSAAKLYVVQVRPDIGTGARSWLYSALRSIREVSSSSTRPSRCSTWFVAPAVIATDGIVGCRVPGCQDAGVSGCRGAGGPGRRGAGVPGCQGARVLTPSVPVCHRRGAEAGYGSRGTPS